MCWNFYSSETKYLQSVSFCKDNDLIKKACIKCNEKAIIEDCIEHGTYTDDINAECCETLDNVKIDYFTLGHANAYLCCGYDG